MVQSSYFLKTLLFYFLLTLIACDLPAQQTIEDVTRAETQKPNIIYILADDLGYGEIGPYGQKLITTPSLDVMAREGMMFTQHYSGSTVCAPSRSSLMTGQDTGRTFIRGNKNSGGEYGSGQYNLAANTKTVGTMLQKSGYKTAIIGKWGLGSLDGPGHPNKMGFDYFYGYLDQRAAHNYYPQYCKRR